MGEEEEPVDDQGSDEEDVEDVEDKLSECEYI